LASTSLSLSIVPEMNPSIDSRVVYVIGDGLQIRVMQNYIRNSRVRQGEPDAGNLPVRFDEREQETEPSQTGLKWRGESQVD
jgi:hypothetical protein